MSARKQCRLCPWKSNVDPADIPTGFNYETHRRLGEEIRRTSSQIGCSIDLHMMACHDTPTSGPKQKPCVGWLANQLGPGNNLVLRLRAMRGDDLTDVETVGSQRKSYEEIRPNAYGDPNCKHPLTKPGLRVTIDPYRDGHLRSEVCCYCGAFRTLSSLGDMKSLWQPWAKYLELVESGDMEDE